MNTPPWFRRSLPLMVTALIVTPVSASAAPKPVHPPAVTSPAVSHRYFGYLTNERGTTLALRLRSGNSLVVDAAAAFAAARVSAPLFAGKPIVVDGTWGVDNVFHATIVKRASPNPTSWDIDR